MIPRVYQEIRHCYLIVVFVEISRYSKKVICFAKMKWNSRSNYSYFLYCFDIFKAIFRPLMYTMMIYQSLCLDFVWLMYIFAHISWMFVKLFFKKSFFVLGLLCRYVPFFECYLAYKLVAYRWFWDWFFSPQKRAPPLESSLRFSGSISQVAAASNFKMMM